MADDQDFLSTITNGQTSDADLAPSKPSPAAPGQRTATAPKFASDLDAATRTAIGEDASHPDAIAAVLYNRAQASGKSVSQVAMEPGQFETWQDPKNVQRLMAIDPNSAVYKAAAAEIAPVLAGKADPTGGALSYYNPSLQASEGRPKPAMDDGTGQQIGQQLYFKGGYGGAPSQSNAPGAGDFLGTITAGKASDADLAPKQPGPNAPQSSAELVNYSSENPTFEANPAQTKSARQWQAAGYYDDSAGAIGTSKQPYFQTSQDQEPAKSLPPGAYYWDWNGKLQQTPGKPITAAERVTVAPAQGVQDIGNSFANFITGPLTSYDNMMTRNNPLIPKSQAQQIANAPDPYGDQLRAQVQTERNAYDARYANDGLSNLGRMAGNIAGTAPILAAGGEFVAPVARALGPVGEFMMGNAAGKASAPISNALIRGTSLATHGAAEGAAAAALNSSASDAPLSQQMAYGAMFGAGARAASPIAGAAAQAGGNIVNGLLEPLTDAGRTKIVNKLFQTVATGGPTDIDAQSQIPGVQRTLAQATGNPGIAAQERAMRNNPQFNNLFTAMDAGNNQARQSFLTGIVGDENDLQALKDQRDAVATPLRQQAFANASPADPRPVVGAIDDVLKSPSGQRDVVASALGNIRDKLVTTGPDGQTQLQTDPEQLYGVRQAIGDMLNPLSAGTQSDKRLASSELMGVKQSLDDAIEQAAPGYKDYLQQYSQLSRPVDEAQYLQGLKLDDGNMRGQITLGDVNSAITKIEKAQAQAGVNPAKSVSDSTMQQLYALRDDLRAAGGTDIGRGTGSDTAQKLASDGLRKALTATKIGNVLLTMGGGAAGAAIHGPEGAGMGTLLGTGANVLYAQKAGAIDQKVANFLLNPNAAGLDLTGAGKPAVGLAGIAPVSQDLINKLIVPTTVSTASTIRNVRARNQNKLLTQ